MRVISTRADLGRALAFAGWLLLSCKALPVRAEPQREGVDVGSAWVENPTAVCINVGFGTPVGYVGLTVDHALIERLSGSLGFGLGSGRGGGSLHLAAGLLARILQLDEAAVYLGADYSTGGWSSLGSLDPSTSGSEQPQIFADRLHWLQGSLGIEARFYDGLVLRPFLGIAAMLNPGSRKCRLEPGGGECFLKESNFGSSTIAVVGLALGYAE